MSTGDDNPLIRWSRRKTVARRGGGTGSGTDAPAAVPMEPAASAVPAGRERAEPEAAAPLPSLDDLTAESDLAVFLRRDVPEQLKAAALRKMWSLDPAIRDHIGLAENSWDFTRPETIPGFGPLDASVAAPDFFSEPMPAVQPDPDAPSESVRAPETAAAKTRIEQEPRASAALPPVEEVSPSRAGPADDIASGESSDTAKPGVASRHGGALPRE